MNLPIILWFFFANALFLNLINNAFDTVLIKNAYKEAIENNIQATDDASMLELQGKDVYVVEGDYDNIKITTKEDLK